MNTKKFLVISITFILALTLAITAALASSVLLKGGKNAEPSFTDNGLTFFHVQLDHIFRVRGQLDAQVLQVEEDRVVVQAGDNRWTDARDLIGLVAVAAVACASVWRTDRSSCVSEMPV